MYFRKISFSMFIAVITTAITLGALSLDSVQAAANPVVNTSVLQQTMPMTHTMPMTNTMPMTGAMTGAMDGAQGVMPMQPGMGQPGMVQMMSHMAKMQGMMAKMQRMMTSDMLGGDMPMTADMQQRMSEMQGMMAEMQGMMAEMQGMMAGGMMGGGASGGMGQPQGGGMMSQMPMMGAVIMVMPMPMQGGMMQGGMMQGMNMGSMMGGQNAPQRGPSVASDAQGDANPAAAPQTVTLGDIAVKVTPPDLTNLQGETIDFIVDLNATGVDLSFDLAKHATLLIGDQRMPAEAWKVTLDHDHHVAGVLKFPAHMQGAVDGATVVFTDPAGGPEASVSWTTAE